MKTTLNILALLLLCLSAQAQKHTLQLNLKKGEVYPQRMTIHSVVKQAAAGQTIDITIDMISSVEYKVNNVTAEGYVFDATYKELSMKVAFPGAAMSFSSGQTGADDMVSRLLNNIVGKPFQIKMTRLGKITDATNLQQILESAFKESSGLSEEQRGQISGAFGTESFKRNLESFSGIYPTQAVAKGDTWTVHHEAPGNIGMSMDAKYTLSETTATHYVLNANSTLNTDTQQSVGGDRTAQVVLGGTLTGNLKLDRKTGWVSDGKITTSMKGTTTMSKAGADGEDVKIPMEMTMEMSINK
ncbi:DUF6263 family protein [Pedobacter faecalis]|uniref:DUF6263 family protein n=1 Tax=Pedobacter faecalis TaxID=3041495 RepID=UPI0025515AFB|nr:DUF6263 family protein [Pedobacter sp. ELA7]